ncbi:hypothetical protein [Sphingomonas abietis]|uniref:NHR domain-containing protein n=1 Tax=Sphingomonas abietis TaxID=3012344 RepID=A0ABY7NJ25_9SPHN|nr:hypothetical protein [Sphingomonas abietis]WBO20990.1 hypothetical protein PBT88_12320 [Sphingomonas abietis]
MSVARSDFLRNLDGIVQAIDLEAVAKGALGTGIPPSLFVLRRGILVTGLIALETFVRERTVEALGTLERWPRSYEELPEKLRTAARLNALSYLQSFARMLKRQDDDYEYELKAEIAKMASGDGTVLRFTKFVSGDYTGNLSDAGLKELLSNLQVENCWNTFRVFAGHAGIGVPSVQEIVKSTVRKRHRSAHSSTYSPTATEIVELPLNLLCIALCFDVSISASMEQALADPARWARGELAWSDAVNLYFTEPHHGRFRLLKPGATRAMRIVDTFADAKAFVPRPVVGSIAVLVEHDTSGRPVVWAIL